MYKPSCFLKLPSAYFIFPVNRIVGELTQTEVWNKKKKISAVLDMLIDGLLFRLPNYLTARLTQWPTRKFAGQNGIISRDSVEDTNVVGLRINVSGHCCKCSEIIQNFSRLTNTHCFINFQEASFSFATSCLIDILLHLFFGPTAWHVELAQPGHAESSSLIRDRTRVPCIGNLRSPVVTLPPWKSELLLHFLNWHDF